MELQKYNDFLGNLIRRTIVIVRKSHILLGRSLNKKECLQSKMRNLYFSSRCNLWVLLVIKVTLKAFMFFDKSHRGFDNKYMNIGIALVTYVHPL